MMNHFFKDLVITGLLVCISMPAVSQVSITNVPGGITPQSMLHVHSNSSFGQILQLTNATTGYNLPTLGFSIQTETGFKTIFRNQHNNANAGIAFSTNVGTNVERLTIKNNGFIGINNTSPNATLDISGSFNQNFGTATGNGMLVTGATSTALGYFYNTSTDTEPIGLVAGITNTNATGNSYGIQGFNYGSGPGIYGTSTNGYGVYGRCSNASNYGFLGSWSYGAYGTYGTYSFGYLGSGAYGAYGVWNSTGNFGYLGSEYYGVYGRHNPSFNYGYIGGTDFSVFGYLSSGNAGDYAVHGYGVTNSVYAGTGYSVASSLGGVKGWTQWGNAYTFGVAGFSYLDYGRSGAVFGGSSGASTAWGSLSYKNSGNSTYGGYFTTYTSGSGKSSDVMINSGISAWGDLFGADIHGHVYGAYVEGEDYALFTNGTVVKNGPDVHLQREPDGRNLPLYTNVSTDMTVQTAGYATLSGGTCMVEFEPSFTASVSASSPVIVTITPMGNTSGVYLSEVSEKGFSVIENNNGKSSVKISYIAIGKRAGFEDPQVPQAVLQGDYVSKVTSGLHNDSETATSGQGLYYENGSLHVGVHPLTMIRVERSSTDLPPQGH